MNITFIYPHFLWLLLLVPLTAALALLGPRRPNRTRFWNVLALRLALLGLIILALAGIQLRLPTNMLTAVFLLDVSDSIPAEEQARGEEIIREAISAMPAGDRAAVVVFGQDALVERLATEDNSLPGFTSVPVTFRTDIAGALQLGLALFPDQGAKRLVLLSDGRQNLGKGLEQAELAAAHDIELSYIPLEGPHGEVEVLLDTLVSPADARQGQSFDLTTVIHSTDHIGATLRIFADGQLIYSQQVDLHQGTNRFLVPVESAEPGFRRFRAQIIPDADTRLQNNEASAFTVVHGPPRILVVEGNSGEASNMVAALRATKMDVSLISPANLPITLPELTDYDVVILANVPAGALPSGAMQTLPLYVRDLGRGLLMTGGDAAFGAGGYLRSPLEEALPVYMDVRTRDMSANLALVMAVDKSGSMGRCHCDDPDLHQTYVRREVGQPKVDIAKEAVMRAAGALGSQDFLGVIAFDDTASLVLGLDYFPGHSVIEQEIGGIQAHGGTNILAGIEAAYDELVKTDARRKHIILLTDGWTHGSDVRPLAREMAEQGITLSVVAAGSGSAEYLEDLAKTGGGRYYPAEDIMTVPDFFLKDTVQAVGHYIIEEAFLPLPSHPGPALQGLDTATLPVLFGYNGTSPKNTARIDLATPRGDPLLATWQYGLGRAAAWTSDLKGQWASDWIAWDGYTRFVSQLVGWLLPLPKVDGIDAQARLQDGLAIIELEAVDQDGFPLNFLDAVATLVSPDLSTRELRLSQVGAGTYQASTNLTKSGAYLVNIAAYDRELPLSQQTFGLVVPYSPEFREISADLPFLQQLAHISGGGHLYEPAEAFLKNLPASDFAREIWRPLLMVVALLFPLDIAIRRVLLNTSDYRKAFDWLRQRLPSRPIVPASERRAFDHLFRAQQRARQRHPSSATSDLSGKVHLSDKQDFQDKPEVSQPPETDPPTDATLSRLRDAKRRARKN